MTTPAFEGPARQELESLLSASPEEIASAAEQLHAHLEAEVPVVPSTVPEGRKDVDTAHDPLLGAGHAPDATKPDREQSARDAVNSLLELFDTPRDDDAAEQTPGASEHEEKPVESSPVTASATENGPTNREEDQEPAPIAIGLWDGDDPEGPDPVLITGRWSNPHTGEEFVSILGRGTPISMDRIHGYKKLDGPEDIMNEYELDDFVDNPENITMMQHAMVARVNELMRGGLDVAPAAKQACQEIANWLLLQIDPSIFVDADAAKPGDLTIPGVREDLLDLLINTPAVEEHAPETNSAPDTTETEETIAEPVKKKLPRPVKKPRRKSFIEDKMDRAEKMITNTKIRVAKKWSEAKTAPVQKYKRTNTMPQPVRSSTSKLKARRTLRQAIYEKIEDNARNRR